MTTNNPWLERRANPDVYEVTEDSSGGFILCLGAAECLLAAGLLERDTYEDYVGTYSTEKEAIDARDVEVSMWKDELERVEEES